MHPTCSMGLIRESGTVLRSEDGGYVSAHLSMFPGKTIESGKSVNRVSVILWDGKDHQAFALPGNFGFYMSPRDDARLRWLPSGRILSMLRGDTDVVVSCTSECDISTLVDVGTIVPVGWIEYAHSDGMVYSGTHSGFFSTVQEFSVDLADTLIDAYEGVAPVAAKSCVELDKRETKEMDICAKRADFLGNLARAITRDGVEGAMANLVSVQSSVQNLYGEGNFVTELGTDDMARIVLRFPPLE